MIKSMKRVLMSMTHSKSPTAIFSPGAIYSDAIKGLSKGGHYMSLHPSKNSLHESEVLCIVNGVGVGRLHEDEAYEYYREIKRLNKHGMELVVPCRVADSGLVYYRPVSRVKIKEWVDSQILTLTGTITNLPITTGPTPYDSLKMLSPQSASKVQSRIGRHLVKLSSRDFFSPLDSKIIGDFAYALYHYDFYGISSHLTARQDEALVMTGYALHRTAAPSLSYDRRVTIGVDSNMTPVQARAIAIDDYDLARLVVARTEDSEKIARLILDGANPDRQGLEMLLTAPAA